MKVSREQEFEICTKYKNGVSAPAIALEYGVSDTWIRKILSRYGIASRSNSEAQLKLTQIQESEICAEYRNGINSPKLALKYGVSSLTIRNVLQRHGIACRPASEAHLKLMKKIEPDICSKYKNGNSSKVLAVEYKVSSPTICNILIRNSVPLRSFSEAARHGKLNNFYVDGKFNAPYPPEWLPSLQRRIRERDNYTCQLCGKEWGLGRRAFPVHHIDYVKKNNKQRNLITLCPNCHGITNPNPSREYWTVCFHSLIGIMRELE